MNKEKRHPLQRFRDRSVANGKQLADCFIGDDTEMGKDIQSEVSRRSGGASVRYHELGGLFFTEDGEYAEALLLFQAAMHNISHRSLLTVCR